MAKIQTNVAALNAFRNLSATNKRLEDSIRKLSSGFRINKAGDDAAGLSVANRLRAAIRGLNVASRNASQASSVVGIADGTVNTLSTILDRMKELATQAASANTSSSDLPKLDSEFQALKQEVDRMVASTTFQGDTLLDGTFGLTLAAGAPDAGGTLFGPDAAAPVASVSSVAFSAGSLAGVTYTLTDTAGAPQTITMTTSDLGGGATISQTIAKSAESGAQTFQFSQLGITIEVDSGYVDGDLNAQTIITDAAGSGTFIVGAGAGAGLTNADKLVMAFGNLTTGASGLNLVGSDLTTAANSEAAVAVLDAAINTLNSEIGNIGAVQNRLEVAKTNISTLIENFEAAESTIRDADLAEETIEFTKNQVLQQSGLAMLAQANAAPQGVLSLLAG